MYQNITLYPINIYNCYVSIKHLKRLKHLKKTLRKVSPYSQRRALALFSLCGPRTYRFFLMNASKLQKDYFSKKYGGTITFK
jgi:hypothetical protein